MPAHRAGEAGHEYGKYYLANRAPGAAEDMDYNNLPLRTHAEVLKDVRDIRGCRTLAEKEEKQKTTGINDQVSYKPTIGVVSSWISLSHLLLAVRVLDDRVHQLSVVVQFRSHAHTIREYNEGNARPLGGYI